MHSSSDARPGPVLKALPALVLGLLLLLAFRGMLQGRLFYLRDVSQNHYPVRSLVTERLRSGDLPLWDPFHGGGTPLLANPNALVLHPISLLFFVLPFDTAFVASIVLQFVLLAAGGYGLGRSLRLGREASLLVAAVLSLSGPAASLASLQNVLSAAAWVPLALWALLRGTVPGRRFLLAPAALCTAVVLITAEPASILALVLLGCALGATEPASSPGRRSNLAACLAFGMVLAAAALVAAVEIVPARALLPLSARGAGFDVVEGLKWSLLPQRLPEITLPRLFGDPTRMSPVSWWGGFLFEGGYPFLLSIYVGTLPCLLACIGAWHRGPGLARRRALGVIAALALLMALGRSSAAYRILFGALGPLRQVRYPERFLLVFLFAAALLAGYGIERLLASPPSRRAVFGIAAVSAAGFALCACAATARFADGLLSRLAGVPASFLASDGAATLRGALLRSTLWAFGESALLLVLAIYLMARPSGTRARAAALAVVVTASVSLAVASSPARSMAAAGWLTAPSPLRGFVGHGAAEPRLHHARRPPDLSVRGSTDELVWGYRYDRFVYALMTGHADSVPTALDAATDRMDLKDSADLGRSLEALPLDRRVRALTVCRVGYLLSYDPLDDRGLLPGPVLDGLSRPPARLYQVRGVVPRLRFAAHARSLPRDADLAAALSDPAYDPGHAVLLEDAAEEAQADGDGGSGTAAGGEAVVTEETPERITMRVSTPVPGYAVLADAYAPGWRATLDARPVPILRADGLFRAVALPAGEHTVAMEYRPAEVVAGLVLGLVGVLLVTAYGVVARSRKW
jgi:Bacterial membrane protein YfhO